jgi:hypothetical protein
MKRLAPGWFYFRQTQNDNIMIRQKKHALLILLATYLMGMATVHAQPFTLDNNIKPIELNFVNIDPPKKPTAKGRLNVTNITQVADTMYYFGKGFSTYSPVYVGVTAKDKAVPLQVDLCKENWLTASRQGNTGEKGYWEDKFRTEGDFGIRVIAKTKPASYTIVVWNGEDIKVDVPSPFSKDKPGSSGGGIMGFLKKNLVYAIIVVLLLVIGLLFMKMKKNKSGNTA